MSLRLVFTGKQQVVCEEFTLPAMADDDVRLESICSLMSIGTENIVFNRLFAPGTHWDNWVKYPFYPGYSSVSRVVEVGTAVSTLKVGDMVAHRGSHASHHLAKTTGWTGCIPLPQDLDPRQAAWHSLNKIAFVGARNAGYRLGDSVLVIGAGPIGQMSLRWAVAAGAGHVVVVDTMPKRLEMARLGGATAVLDQPLEGLGDALRQICDGELPRVVVDTTGAAPVFAQALKLVRDRGCLVLLGDTGSPGEQRLTPDLISRGLHVVGAHDCHEDDGWGNVTIGRLFGRLATTGRFNVAGLTTHVFDPRKCVEAYAEVNARRGDTMGVIFDWSLVNAG